MHVKQLYVYRHVGLLCVYALAVQWARSVMIAQVHFVGLCSI